MMNQKRMVKNKLLLLFCLIITGCSGALFGFHNLDKKYEEKTSNEDIEFIKNSLRRAFRRKDKVMIDAQIKELNKLLSKERCDAILAEIESSI